MSRKSLVYRLLSGLSWFYNTAIDSCLSREKCRNPEKNVRLGKSGRAVMRSPGHLENLPSKCFLALRGGPRILVCLFIYPPRFRVEPIRGRMSIVGAWVEDGWKMGGNVGGTGGKSALYFHPLGRRCFLYSRGNFPLVRIARNARSGAEPSFTALRSHLFHSL